MKVMKIKSIVCIIITLFYLFPLTSAISDDGFELGTQFEGSFLLNAKETPFSLSLPSSVPSLGTSLPSLYGTWYPNEYIGITGEGSFGYSRDSGTISYGGLGISYLPYGYESSTMCLSLRGFYYGLYNIKNIGNSHLVGIGPGVGWSFGDYSNFIRRFEIQYRFLHGIGDDRKEHKISFLVGTGVLF